MGYGDPGFTGDPSASTPHLDALAAGGKRLTNWYSGYAVCSASRTALLTGRQAPRVGMVGVINSLSAVGLPLTEVTMGVWLQVKSPTTTHASATRGPKIAPPTITAHAIRAIELPHAGVVSTLPTSGRGQIHISQP